MAELFKEIERSLILPDPTQPRKLLSPEMIERLAMSIIARGMLVPIRVRYDAAKKVYIILLGETRFHAAGHAVLATVPCIVLDGDITEADLLADRLTENHVRQDLTPLEFPRGLAKLKTLKRCTSKALADELGLSAAAISRAEALLSLPLDLQELVENGLVPESAGYEISRLPDEASQRELGQAVAAGRISRDAAAEKVRNQIGRRKVAPKSSRVACRFDDGMAITMSSGEALDWESVLKALDRLRKEARKLCDAGQDVSTLAKVMRPSGG